MDLLIEAIVWLFRNLFGQQESQAHLGSEEQDETTDSKRGSRGPYRYGDERSARSGTGPKTLAELREEARRQMEGGPAAPPPIPLPPARRMVVAPPEPAGSKRAELQVPPVPPIRTATALLPRLSEQARTTQVLEHSIKKKKRKPPPLSTRTQTAPLPKPAVALSLNAPPPQSAAIPQELKAWLEALGSQGTEAKRAAGMRAIASLEILGPPRCRRPFRSA